jgi:type VI secretion system protein ImpG
MGLDDGEALLPIGPRGFHGYRLLHEYFAFPSRFSFARLRNIGRAVRACRGHELELVIALDRHDPSVQRTITPGHLAPFCTPAINLFPKKADRIVLGDGDHEYHVVGDRTRPLDFETHSVLEVTGFGAKGEVRRTFGPLYAHREGSRRSDDGAFFTVHRSPRRVSSPQKDRSARSSYHGGEVFVSLVDGRGGPYQSDLRQLGVNALCTNRDLPLLAVTGSGGGGDFFVESGAPVRAVDCVAGPTPPRASQASGTMAWRLISHLSLNYLSLTDAQDGSGATALRELLRLYRDVSDAPMLRQIEGLRSAVGRPIVRRLPLAGPPSFARGIEVALECDDSAFEGGSVVLLGLVLAHVLARYVSINSFTETVLRTVQRGEITRWPPKIGCRPSV